MKFNEQPEERCSEHGLVISTNSGCVACRLGVNSDITGRVEAGVTSCHPLLQPEERFLSYKKKARIVEERLLQIAKREEREKKKILQMKKQVQKRLEDRKKREAAAKKKKKSRKKKTKNGASSRKKTNVS